MPRCRVVRPSVVRLPLSEGDWIDVVHELNAGEYFDFMVALADRKGFAKILAYVVGWSLVGLDEQPIPYAVTMHESERLDRIRSLDWGTTRELQAALDRHELAQNAAIEKKKAATSGAPDSSPISSSAAP